jgi:hypothetical protein
MLKANGLRSRPIRTLRNRCIALIALAAGDVQTNIGQRFLRAADLVGAQANTGIADSA